MPMVFSRVSMTLPLALVALASTDTSQAQPPPGSVAAIYPGATLILGLPVGRSPAIEHSRIDIPVNLEIKPGAGGARPTYDLAVCTEDERSCVGFPNVTPPWQSPAGTKLTVDAPAASERTDVRLVACVAARNADSILGCGARLAEDQVGVVTAMQLAVYVESITISHTRARSRDTNYTALAAILDGQSAPQFNECLTQLAGFQLEPPVHCVGPIPAGDLGDGTHNVTRVRVGAYQLVPGRRRNLTIGFLTMNYGAPSGIGPTVDMREIAKVTMLNKLTSTIVDEDFAHEINDKDGWRGCDGPTSGGSARLYNHRSADQTQPTLDELTRASGRYSTSSKVFVVTSQSGCGASSRYQINWGIERTSWRAY